jgi:hypothetical protein
MSFKPENAPQYQTPETIESLEAMRYVNERVQFSDGQLGLLHRTHGDTVDFMHHKWGDVRLKNCAIVKMSNGERYAFGGDVAVRLGELNSSAGEFMKPKGNTSVARLADIAPNGYLPPATIGSSWQPLDNQGTVESVMLRYKASSPGEPGAIQVDMPNYFDSAIALLNKVRDHYGFQEAPMQ